MLYRRPTFRKFALVTRRLYGGTAVTGPRNQQQQKTQEHCYDSMSRYEEAVHTLNTLQSNFQYLRSASDPKHKQQKVDTLTQAEKYLNRINVSLEELDKLQVIHVAGTKGKGSTCAFCETILRHHGFKTGFFSSPHLLEVRERIRINGKPIEKHEFATHFFKTYRQLDEKKESPSDMPAYFRFLTLMAFRYFLEVQVDVAIIEVGIGGEYDYTNVLRKVPVVGITSLGIDHTLLLGDTIESIAWQKGGIMKKGSKAFTVEQPAGAMQVLEKRSLEKQCSLQVVRPDASKLDFLRNKTLPFEILIKNASLALELSKAWIGTPFSEGTALNALEKCVWPGRYEIRKINNVTYYLDGAHTLESLQVCTDWYEKMTSHSSGKKVLMFNLTGTRDPKKLLALLKQLRFDVVLFVPNICHGNRSSGDNLTFTDGEQLERCERHLRLWNEIETTGDGFVGKQEKAQVFADVSMAIGSLRISEKYDLLATGSLHLIGALLEILDPNLNNNNNNCR